MIPFDNDAFVRYRSIEFGKPTESYGVTAFFDGGSRHGLVMGAVEHTDWKTAIAATTSPKGDINSLQLYGGASSTITRDLIPHGKGSQLGILIQGDGSDDAKDRMAKPILFLNLHIPHT